MPNAITHKILGRICLSESDPPPKLQSVTTVQADLMGLHMSHTSVSRMPKLRFGNLMGQMQRDSQSNYLCFRLLLQVTGPGVEAKTPSSAVELSDRHGACLTESNVHEVPVQGRKTMMAEEDVDHPRTEEAM